MPTVPTLDRDDARLLAPHPLGRRAAPGDRPWTEFDEVLHDVGNSLTVALGYARLLQLHPPSCAAPKDLEALRAIEANVIHAVNLLTRHAVRGHAAVCDLITLTREAIAQVPPERAGDVAVRWSGEFPPTALGDPLVVARILANLLDNAAKYSPPGTPIVVAMAPADAGIEIVVRDRGIGVPEAKLEAIFTGHRTDDARVVASGHGLGLRSSRRLADEMGGRLWATNDPDGGTAFHLWLPAPPRPEPRVASVNAGAEPGRPAPRAEE